MARKKPVHRSRDGRMNKRYKYAVARIRMSHVISTSIVDLTAAIYTSVVRNANNVLRKIWMADLLFYILTIWIWMRFLQWEIKMRDARVFTQRLLIPKVGDCNRSYCTPLSFHSCSFIQMLERTVSGGERRVSNVERQKGSSLIVKFSWG